MTSPIRFPRGLYGITPEWDDTEALRLAIANAAAGGMTALQWRRKNIAPGQRVAQAREVVAQCRTLGVVSIINDDWRLAALVDADGVHLGRDDGSLAEARIALGTDKIIGCSCYNEPALAALALEGGADYVAFGAIYPSSTKPQAVHATLEHIKAGRLLAESRGERPRPSVVAIGGITAENAAAVIHAGADSVAMISALFSSSDIRATAARCSALFA
ncbi:thiamine phosphate synthase [Allopusillimonas soli]|uniref:Thiamine-phosphate synthase n=1 Tax=Allopusillimonas soli TaxID=659016 RepID=A0A853F892_9BURK|nr:thiamine phosphate synthase [Allopusillimonas soli]NYT36179.1 thiamine phosphate synthase [Allopusillimonas soli]TEA76512.1 thiamine phosphate synthase [Allopusillimonas soli]